MSISIKYFRTNPGGFYESPGKMILSGRKAYFPDEGQTGTDLSAFHYSPVKSWVVVPKDGQKPHRYKVNFVFMEQTYKVGQREILTWLSWSQQQKLKWMYKDHWLQKPGNLFHAVLIMLIISLLVTGIVYLEASGLF